MPASNNSGLISFDAIFDKDFGIIQYGLRNITKFRFLNPLLSYTEDYIKFLLIYRLDINPLSIVGNYNESLYNILYHNKVILPYCSKTLLYDFVQKITVVGEGVLISLTILCDSEDEERFIKSHFPNIRTYIGDWNLVPNESFASVYIKNIKDLEKFKILDGKTIYIQRYLFNFELEKDILLERYSLPYMDINIFKIIDIYLEEDLPVG